MCSTEPNANGWKNGKKYHNKSRTELKWNSIACCLFILCDSVSQTLSSHYIHTQGWWRRLWIWSAFWHRRHRRCCFRRIKRITTTAATAVAARWQFWNELHKQYVMVCVWMWTGTPMWRQWTAHNIQIVRKPRYDWLVLVLLCISISPTDVAIEIVPKVVCLHGHSFQFYYFDSPLWDIAAISAGATQAKAILPISCGASMRHTTQFLHIRCGIDANPPTDGGHMVPVFLKFIHN